MTIRQAVWTLVLVHSQMDGHDFLELHTERLKDCWTNWLQSAYQRHLLWLVLMDKRTVNEYLTCPFSELTAVGLRSKIISLKLKYSITLRACPVYSSVRWSLLVNECSQAAYTVMWRPLEPCIIDHICAIVLDCQLLNMLRTIVNEKIV
jgi:hypothetical protein